MIFDKAFKEAIGRLSSSEKDKLIFRLLKKDLDLANQLYFELVSGDSKESRRKETLKKLQKMVNSAKEPQYYFSPGILLMHMRDTSGVINEHVKITKDKYGEVSLQIFVLKEFLKIHNTFFKDSPLKKAYTMNIYFVVKAFKIMVLLKKMHEDSLLDFADDLAEIGWMFRDNPVLMNVAIKNGLDVNWLVGNKIPDNIAEIEKNLRQQGFLK
ncbi:MAG: hypothetical protein LBD35_05340 [Prevotellaceae bacterium]|jgi:hypothetical protein|nr:hypothetical protein [Prevotellaceae bacterium]